MSLARVADALTGRRTLVLVVAVGVIFVGAVARADAARFTATAPAWKKQCGACHIPYPPALLPAESWRRLMTHLDRHFGINVKIAAKEIKTITAFLVANAGRALPSGAAAPLRITETAWFAYKHDDVPAGTWTVTAVRNGANCEACHRRAAQGDFSERTLKIPKKP